MWLTRTEHKIILNIHAAQAVEIAIRLLQMTAAAGHFLLENHLYKCFRLLQRVREALPATKEEEAPQSRSIVLQV